MKMPKEHFDRQIQKLVTKEDLSGLLRSQTQEPKDCIDESFAAQREHLHKRFGKLITGTGN